MVHVIEDLQWQQIAAGSTSAFKACPAGSKSRLDRTRRWRLISDRGDTDFFER